MKDRFIYYFGVLTFLLGVMVGVGVVGLVLR